MGIEHGGYIPESEINKPASNIHSFLETLRDSYFTINPKQGIAVGKLIVAFKNSPEANFYTNKELTEAHQKNLKSTIENYVANKKSDQEGVHDLIDMINFIDKSNKLHSQRTNN